MTPSTLAKLKKYQTTALFETQVSRWGKRRQHHLKCIYLMKRHSPRQTPTLKAAATEHSPMMFPRAQTACSHTFWWVEWSSLRNSGTASTGGKEVNQSHTAPYRAPESQPQQDVKPVPILSTAPSLTSASSPLLRRQTSGCAYHTFILNGFFYLLY